MKVLLINGSPNKNGCTRTALDIVAKSLSSDGIETQTVHIGSKPISGCIACWKCEKSGYCIFTNDPVNECIDLLKSSDGIVVGSPVYFASPNGSLLSLLDRMFFLKDNAYALKPGAAIVSARRAGTTAALDVLNKYFLYASMPLVSSQYWNMVHGMTPDEVYQDKEGIQIMQVLGKNMAWLLHSIQAGKGLVPAPKYEKREQLNFIR